MHSSEYGAITFIYFFMQVANNFILCYFSRSALTVWQYDSCHKVCKCRIFMVAGQNCPLTFFKTISLLQFHCLSGVALQVYLKKKKRKASQHLTQ